MRSATRPRLRHAIGVLWLLDGFLQLQPFMWTHRFGAGTLAAAAEGQPRVVAGPVRLFARIVAAHPVPFNLVFVVAQLALGAGLLLAKGSRLQRLCCAGSVAWALGVWTLGEGLGGLLGGHTSLSVGAPGAALLYAVVSLAAWPSDRPLDRWVPVAWAAIWLSGALLQVLPGQRTGVGLGDQVEMASMMSPALLARPELHLALWLASQPIAVAGLLTGALAAGQAWVGLGALRGGATRVAAIRVGAGVAVFCWVICQGFGGISTGTATDPGSAPALLLLAWAIACVPAPGGLKPVPDRATSIERETTPTVAA